MGSFCIKSELGYCQTRYPRKKMEDDQLYCCPTRFYLELDVVIPSAYHTLHAAHQVFVDAEYGGFG
jgi:hypothetical protein